MKNTMDKKTAYIMVQGTMSNAGKSLVAAGLCRVFRQDGFKVCPFKSQNMALNSYVTEDGLEMGRAQVMQAEAAGVKPSVYMNPILLKPTGNMTSQVIVNGKVHADMSAKDYFAYKKKLLPDIQNALDALGEEYDIIVIEGAGSPAEINLKENDIVNMGIAKLTGSPVILVGDIDRGGVFAQLYGTVALLDEDEKKLIKGLVINKFRGDKTILDPGIDQIESLMNIPVCGCLPYMDIRLDDEDSLAERLNNKQKKDIDIVVIRLGHISNFTDFNVFDEYDNVSVRYVKDPEEIEGADLLIIPGSKNTIADMRALKDSGMDEAIRSFAENGKPVIGICGGFQMLGEKIEDEAGAEGGGEAEGIGLLPILTELTAHKKRVLCRGQFGQIGGVLGILSGRDYSGYEIHMGNSRAVSGGVTEFTASGTGFCTGSVYGTYVHGIFDEDGVSDGIVSALCKAKGLEFRKKNKDHRSFKESQYDKLADMIRKYMDMDAIYEMMGLENGNI